MKFSDRTTLKFIDAYVLVHDHINTAPLMDAFGFSRTKASSMLQIYLKGKPSNLRYNTSESRYDKSYVFEPIFLGKNTSALMFLEWIDIVNTSFEIDESELCD